MVHKRVHRLLTESRMHPAQLSAVFHQKIVAQVWNVFSSFPKRRKPDTNAIDPVIKFAPETPRLHLLIEIPARSRDQPRHQNSSSRFRFSVRERVKKIPLARSVKFTDF